MKNFLIVCRAVNEDHNRQRARIAIADSVVTHFAAFVDTVFDNQKVRIEERPRRQIKAQSMFAEIACGLGTPSCEANLLHSSKCIDVNV